MENFEKSFHRAGFRRLRTDTVVDIEQKRSCFLTGSKKKEKNSRFLPPFISANIFRRSFSSRFFFFLFNPLKSVNTFRVDGDNCLPDSSVRDARFPRSIKRNGQSKVRDGQREMDSATTMETTRGAYNQDMHLPCIQFVTISWRMIRVRAVR